MALTDKQRAAIRSQIKKNIAKRAATQRTKVSPSEARTVSSRMNKRPGATPSFTLRDKSILTKNERDTLGATSKANADKEKMMQKNRNFAKGTGKLPVKNRVGTKAEYKQLGKDIEMRKQLIARSKAARAAQAARKANPAPTTPAKTTPLTKPKVTKAEIKSVTAKLKELPKAPPMSKSDIAKFERQTDLLVAKDKAAKSATPKASTAAVKKRTSPNTNPKTSKPKVTETKKLQTLDEAKAKAPKPKVTEGKKLQTLDQAKASAPKPRGPMLGPEKPSTTLTKPAGKVASKVDAAKKAAKSTTAGRVVKATKAASKPIVEAASKTKTGKVLKATGKVVKVGGKLLKIPLAYGAVKEVGQFVSGQAEKDFRRIQALENRIAVAKGKKPKYTRSGSKMNLVQSLKVDAANALSFVGAGQSRKDRLQELKTLAAKAEKNKLTKPAAKPAAKSGAKPASNVPSNLTGLKPAVTSGNKYTVKKGDTLSAIASRSGVSLKDIRDANPKFAAQAKYKNGNMIFSGTSVTIPKKKAK